MLRCYSDADFYFVSDEWSAASLPCDYSTATGINVQKGEEDIKVYPNPFSEKIFVSTNSEGYIKIVDITSKITYYSELLNGINEISTNSFPKGIYIVKIHNKDSSIQSFKIVKM